MDLDTTIKYIENAGDDCLFILWTSDNVLTANNMVFMYAENAIKKAMWKDIMIILWGASTKLVAENKEIQNRVKHLQELGIKFSACVTCAEELDVKDTIKELHIDLVKWLVPMTVLLKGGKKILSV